MAEEVVENTAEETVVDKAEDKAPTETDWQAKYEAMRQHSRDWEKKAKENAAAASELEALKQAQLTEQEKATARAEKAESELAAMKAEAQRQEDARVIANETGVPLELLEYCADKDAMEQFARIYQAKQPTVHAAAPAVGTKVHRGSGQPITTAQQFADAIENQL